MGAVPILEAPQPNSIGYGMRRRVGIVAFILVMIAIGIWAVLPRSGGSPGSGASGPVTNIPVHAAQIPGSLTVAKAAAVSGLWARPAAKLAARNSRRVRFSNLRRLGASDQIVDRLTNGDAAAVIQELKQRAHGGDATAGNILFRIVRLDCNFARMDVAHPELRALQAQEAHALSEEDAAWMQTALEERLAFDQQLADACSGVTRSEAEGWVNKAADDGNPASLYLRYGFRPNQSASTSQRQLKEAVDAGYPEAQAWLAQSLTGGAPGLPKTGEDADTLFKEAAETLPYAESLLAICEFTGCPGVEADIPSAVAHAREAAQRGSFDAMIQIGPKLQASQIDPNEVQAWNLVGTMLAQQGCSGDGLSVQGMTSWTSTLASKTTPDKARSLAEQYWQDYGQQMMSNIGCTP